MRLLLLSNSRTPDAGYLDHAEGKIRQLFSGIQRILFVPFALHDQRQYTQLIRDRLSSLGIQVDRLEPDPAAIESVNVAEGIFIGGGNTFRLLDHLHRLNLLEPIRRRVKEGIPYMGSSAGSVVACPTIKTTNDMPIVQPPSFEALGLVPFQINCHYLDPDPNSRHMGETRGLRLTEFLEENTTPVIGLREGAMLEVCSDSGRATTVTLSGTAGARIFRRDSPPAERNPGMLLNMPLA